MSSSDVDLAALEAAERAKAMESPATRVAKAREELRALCEGLAEFYKFHPHQMAGILDLERAEWERRRKR